MAEANLCDARFDSSSGDSEQKVGMPSPPMTGNFNFPRTPSTGSIDILTSSSAHNTDDEDSDHKSTMSYKERRREAHTQAEQKRRDGIKKGYEDLQSLVPTCQQQLDSIGSSKLSKATVLQRSIDYMQFLIQQKKKQEEDLNTLRKEVIALQIMKANYEQIVKVHQNQPGHSRQVSDEVKFQLFQAICDSLFQSFNSSTSVANFAELSGCVFRWLEEHCKPESLRDLVLSILQQITQPSS